MNTPITCPGCRNIVEVPEELVGKRVRCPVPECGLTYTAEVRALPLPPPAPAYQPPPPPPSLSEQYGIPPIPRPIFQLHLGWAAASVASVLVTTAALLAVAYLLLVGRGTPATRPTAKAPPSSLPSPPPPTGQ